ncbi:MAG: hypothetical protein QXL71_09115 [Candidatus Bathyarchaeia archaeon]
MSDVDVLKLIILGLLFIILRQNKGRHRVEIMTLSEFVGAVIVLVLVLWIFWQIWLMPLGAGQNEKG